jgi:hypothetical protein
MSEGQHNRLAAMASLGAGDSLWQACVDQLAQELPEQQFNTWIKPLVAQVAKTFPKSRCSWPTASSSTGCGPSTPAASRPC